MTSIRAQGAAHVFVQHSRGYLQHGAVWLALLLLVAFVNFARATACSTAVDRSVAQDYTPVGLGHRQLLQVRGSRTLCSPCTQLQCALGMSTQV
jgi:hypothetical protein